MVGEFGRSPRISAEGRDHWPACYTSLLAGAGIRGGVVRGSSDKTGGYSKFNPLRRRFRATLFHALEVPPKHVLPDLHAARSAGQRDWIVG